MYDTVVTLSMNLVIVESPTKAKKLSQYLGKDFVVEASKGHVRDLPKSKLGVDIENGFLPTYETIRGSGQIVGKLLALAKKADTVYLAADPDREGEAIVWHLLQAWENKDIEKKSVRSVFHEITKDAVLEAINHPQKLNIALVDAQQARRVLDRLVGYKLSPVLWKKVRRGLSAGRVQSVALRLIVEREKEILAFKPEEYWEVDVLLKALKEQLTFRVIELNGKAYDPHSESDVEKVRSWSKDAKYVVADTEKKQRTRKPYPPFTTSTLQQAAANRLGMSAKRSMQLAQQLYEEGFITYHRTDATALSSTALAMAREYIEKEFGVKYLPEKPNFYATKSKNAQEAHEAIRPTSDKPAIAETGKLTEAHQKLYDLIFRRFIASQMNNAVYDLTTVTVSGTLDANKLKARTSGSVITHPGWMTLFPGGEDVILPVLDVNEELPFIDLLTVQKFTQPPARYNDASIVKELEKRGIGRPSTYASIISVIEARGYVERQNKAFQPTAIGTTVIEFLLINFPEIIDYDFTAHMEDDLDDIALGKKQWQGVLKQFYEPFATKLGEVEETSQRMQVPVEPLNKPCPTCGVKPEAFEKLMAKKETLSTRPEGDYPPMREATHGELVLRMGRFGKFISCSRYPECEHTERWVEKIDVPCPTCGSGDVVVKKTKKGRTFYGCSRYPECDFASWTKPGAAANEEG
jgi:DNA topoisomerase-1